MPQSTRQFVTFCMIMLLATACGRADIPTVGLESSPLPSGKTEQTSLPTVAVDLQLSPAIASTTEQVLPPPLPTEQQPVLTAVPQSTITVACPMLSYYVDVHSLAERTALAEVVVVGKITGRGDIMNGSFDVDDNTKPASDRFSIAREYTFQVQQYIKGVGPNELPILNGEGVVDLPPEKVTPQAIEQARACEPDAPYQLGATYLLFLNTIRFHNGKDYYYTATLPSRYQIEPDGQAVMLLPKEAGLLEWPQDLYSQPGKPFLAEVERAVAKEQAR